MLQKDGSSSMHGYLSETKIEVYRYYLIVILSPQSFHYFADSSLCVLAKSYMENYIWPTKIFLEAPADCFLI